MIKKYRLADLDVRSRLIFIIFATTALGLILATVGLTLTDRKLTRKYMITNLDILAGVVGWNSRAAVTFNDEKAGLDALEALRFQPHIEAAYIFDNAGRIFASFNRTGAPPQASPEVPEADRHWFDGSRLFVAQGMWLNDEKIGTIYIQSDTGELAARLRAHLWDAALLIAGTLVITYFVSTRMQSVITVPIFQLVDVTREVSRNGNYAVRAKKSRNDELGTLVDGFNSMLSEIQRRDGELELARRELEERVVELDREVTERQRAEAALSKQTLELERSNGELEQFAYVASHDLQEPLRAISGCLQILHADYESQLDDDAVELIDHSVAGSQRMKTLINDLLDYSRVGTRAKEFELIETNSIIADVLQNLDVIIKEQHADIIVGELPTIMADSTQIIQLFQNLIGNAIKFCRNGTPQVTISATRIQNDSAEPKALEPRTNGKEFWQFSVIDNGIGIETQYAERIFVIFQRLHNRTEYEGTGIGLSVCKKIVERHGGKIRMTSEPGKGTTFNFTIPVVESTVGSQKSEGSTA